MHTYVVLVNLLLRVLECNVWQKAKVGWVAFWMTDCYKNRFPNFGIRITKALLPWNKFRYGHRPSLIRNKTAKYSVSVSCHIMTHKIVILRDQSMGVVSGKVNENSITFQSCTKAMMMIHSLSQKFPCDLSLPLILYVCSSEAQMRLNWLGYTLSWPAMDTSCF